MEERRVGVVAGLAAYGMWGLFPLYFPLLEPAGGLEIVAHRVVWSLLFIALLLTVLRRWPLVRAAVRDRRTMLVLSGAAVLIAANWLVFVYGVNSGHVVETSLGYFINPLVSVLLGVVVFSERLRRLRHPGLRGWDEVRQRHRLAILHLARRGQCRRKRGQLLLHAAHRGALRGLRRASGSCLPGRAGADRAALLHQRRRAGVPARW